MWQKLWRKGKEYRKWQSFHKRCRVHMDGLHAVEDPWQASDNVAPLRYCTQKLLGDRRFQHGLEVGCGQGLVSPLWLEYCENLTCLDISAIAMEKAKANLMSQQGRLSFVTDSIHSYAQRNSSFKKFDFIVLSYVFDYLGFGDFPERTIATLASFLYMLNDGGALVLVNPVYEACDIQKNCSVDNLLQRLGFDLEAGLIQGQVPLAFSYRVFKKR